MAAKVKMSDKRVKNNTDSLRVLFLCFGLVNPVLDSTMLWPDLAIFSTFLVIDVNPDFCGLRSFNF